MAKPKLIVITGPTASGKSAFALEVAEAVGGEIVSADSMQVYRGLDIGTAKPSAAERARVRHHLIDVVDIDEPYHGARFRTDANVAISEVRSRGALPLVVGGTALYLKILLQGLAEAPGREEDARRALEARWEGGEGRLLWEELGRVDPDLGARLHPNDRTRIIRGLEVWAATGRPLSEFHRRHRFGERPYDALVLGMAVAREALYARIDERVCQMIEGGWVAEVQRVLGLGYSPDLPPLQAIGYREICAYLSRGGDLSHLIEEIQRQTRQFAKRQLTWFRRMEVHWIDPGDAPAGIQLVKNFLQNADAPIS